MIIIYLLLIHDIITWSFHIFYWYNVEYIYYIIYVILIPMYWNPEIVRDELLSTVNNFKYKTYLVFTNLEYIINNNIIL